MDELFRFGFQPHLALKIEEMLKLRAQKNVELYQSSENYIEDVTRKCTANVKLDNILDLFFYFGGFFAFSSFVLVMNRMMNIFLFKRLRRVRRKLGRCLVVHVKTIWEIRQFRKLKFWP